MRLRYASVGLMYTRTCPLTCAHCITESSPDVRERMQLAQALSYLEPIARFTPALSITGGEPLLFYRDVAVIVARARQLGLRVGVVTGAGWATNPAHTLRVTSALTEAGLDTLEISWDAYHAAFVPTEHAVALAQAASERGIRVSVRATLPAGVDSAAWRDAFGTADVRFAAATPVPLGRGAELPESHFKRDGQPLSGGCPVLLNPIIEPDGSVLACCGPSRYSGPHSPLRLGNAGRELLEDILERGSTDRLLIALSAFGPTGLRSVMGEEQPPPFRSMCELCLWMTNQSDVVDRARGRLDDFDVRFILSELATAEEHDA